ncbi:hypothetical protein GIB67_006019 [Kingdonia uniflora]|uniref:Uncharacterized protein n=1 Tax=Kingdonia uniflora TaxID=39325 RepID=A0A7J7MBU5_9MAGN|nr:hypothetical protein GIB67_006019 [Kingdonia uniflora]
MTELQSVVAESRSAQLAFGAMGFPVLMSVLKEECDDVEMVRGALETLVSALTPIDYAREGPNNVVQPTLMNSDLLSREAESISLLLSLLAEEDFYVRYYTLQVLTALLTHSPNRLQEAILSTPRGITRLMDMLMDREVIRNEALLLLTFLTREAEEIQKIVVFEGAFEKIFSIIKEEGGSEGGVVVQDCLELLNNLLRKSSSNQILLRETMGFEPIISTLKLRGSAYNFTKQKTVNLLGALETIELLLMGGAEARPGKDADKMSNQTALAQKKLLDHLIVLGVESQWAAVAVRCACKEISFRALRVDLSYFTRFNLGHSSGSIWTIDGGCYLFWIHLRTNCARGLMAPSGGSDHRTTLNTPQQGSPLSGKSGGPSSSMSLMNQKLTLVKARRAARESEVRRSTRPKTPNPRYGSTPSAAQAHPKINNAYLLELEVTVHTNASLEVKQMIDAQREARSISPVALAVYNPQQGDMDGSEIT